MKCTVTLLLIILITPIFSSAQEYYYPPKDGSFWETVAPEELGWCSEKVDSLLSFLEEKNTKSFIVLKSGKMVLEKYFGTYVQDSIWYWASAGKSLMGTMIGLAQEDGYVNIDDKTSDYLGEGWTNCSIAEEAKIKIRHQISMASGFNDKLEEGGSVNNCFEPECFECLAEPESRWAYHNSAYRIVQDVMENASGQDKTIYTRLRLGNRIGMKGFWFNYVFYSKARDMARFGLLTLSKGIWDGDIIMQDTAYFDAMVNTSQGENLSYGYLWWLNGKESFMAPSLRIKFPGSLVPEAPADMIAALGKNDQKIYVIPSLDMVVVRQGESAGGTSLASSSFDNQLWARLMDMECGVTSITTVNSDVSVMLFPNPSQDWVHIQSDMPMNSASLYNATGQMIERYQWNNTFEKINLSNLALGFYWLKVETSKGIVTKKLIRN